MALMLETLPQAPRVLHVLPGRLRVHMPQWSGREVGPIEAQLGQLPGVKCARANPLTGTVLLCFDPRITNVQTLLTEAQALRHDPPAEGPPPVRQPGRLLTWTPPAGEVARTAVKALGMGLTGLRYLDNVKGLTTPAGWLALSPNLACVRRGLAELLGPELAALLLQILELLANLLTGNLLGVLLNGLEVLLRGWPRLGVAALAA